MTYQARFPEDSDDDSLQDDQAERLCDEDVGEEAEVLELDASQLQDAGGWSDGYEQRVIRDKLAKAIRKAAKRSLDHLEQANKAALLAGRLLSAAKPGLRGAAWRKWLREDVNLCVGMAKVYYYMYQYEERLDHEPDWKRTYSPVFAAQTVGIFPGFQKACTFR